MKKFKFLKSNYPTKQDLDTAYMNGYRHFLSGHDRDYNPYLLNKETSEKWLQGWRWAHMINGMNNLELNNEEL